MEWSRLRYINLRLRQIHPNDDKFLNDDRAFPSSILVLKIAISNHISHLKIKRETYQKFVLVYLTLDEILISNIPVGSDIDDRTV